MNNQLQKNNSLLYNKDFLDSSEFKKLPLETQNKILEYYIQKKIDLSTQHTSLIIEHDNADTDINRYLNYINEQQQIQKKANGLNITYNSLESKTPTGRITSKSTHTTASAGCLLPILIIFSLLFI